MFDMSISVWEHIVRAAIVYVFLFVLLRWIGKKHVGELAPFDLYCPPHPQRDGPERDDIGR